MAASITGGHLTDSAAIETWAGEMRVNLVRLASLIAFYGYHLANLYASPNESGIGGAYNFQVTALVMVWAIGVLVLYFQLAPGSMPPMLKFAVVLWDLTLTTTLLVVSGGPRSHLLPILFLIIASAPLRLSLPLVCVATLGSIVSYLIVLGHYVYRVVGADRYYAENTLRIPRTQEVGIVLGLLVAGILAGQVVRQIRHLIDGIGVEMAISSRGHRRRGSRRPRPDATRTGSPAAS